MVDLAGTRFTRLVALRRSPASARKWECVCDCGNTTVTTASNLRTGNTKSCGCLRRDVGHETVSRAQEAKRTHGHSTDYRHTPTYSSWHHMIQRCTNPANDRWAQYGGRGIGVTPRWLAFDAFLADMGERPAGRTLDRIDNDGHYEPGNCRWATRAEQSSSQRRRRPRAEATA